MVLSRVLHGPTVAAFSVTIIWVGAHVTATAKAETMGQLMVGCSLATFGNIWSAFGGIGADFCE